MKQMKRTEITENFMNLPPPKPKEQEKESKTRIRLKDQWKLREGRPWRPSIETPQDETQNQQNMKLPKNDVCNSNCSGVFPLCDYEMK